MALPTTTFTERAKRVLSLAEQIAQDANLDGVPPVHILVALAKADRGTARMVLEKLGIDLPSVIEQVRLPPEQPPRMPCRVVLPLDSASTHLLGFGKEEGKRIGLGRYVGTEHLLLGMLRMNDEYAGHFLVSVGVTLGSARSALSSVLGLRDDPNSKTI